MGIWIELGVFGLALAFGLWQIHDVKKAREATRRAKERVYALRRDPQVRAAKAEVVQRHGSRRTTGNATGSGPRTRSRASRDVASHQLSLDL